MTAPSWQLERGETVVATLTLDHIDQPWFHCRFTAGPAWEGIRPGIEEWTQATLEADASDVLRIAHAWQAVENLGLVLVPLDDLPAISDFLLHVDGATARFRY